MTLKTFLLLFSIIIILVLIYGPMVIYKIQHPHLTREQTMKRVYTAEELKRLTDGYEK